MWSSSHPSVALLSEYEDLDASADEMDKMLIEGFGKMDKRGARRDGYEMTKKYHTASSSGLKGALDTQSNMRRKEYLSATRFYGQTCKLTNFIGTLVKGKEIPLAARNWSKVHESAKEKLWQTVQVKSEKNKAVRAMQLNGTHTTGSRSFAVALDQLELQEGQQVGRAKLYVVSHTKKNGEPVDKYSGDKIEEIKSKFEAEPALCNEEVHDGDVFSGLFPKERSGTWRGLGLLVGGSNSKNLAEIKAELQEARNEKIKLWSVVETLMKNQSELQQQHNALQQKHNELNDMWLASQGHKPASSCPKEKQSKDLIKVEHMREMNVYPLVYSSTLSINRCYLIRPTFFYGAPSPPPHVFDPLLDGTFWTALNATNDALDRPYLTEALLAALGKISFLPRLSPRSSIGEANPASRSTSACVGGSGQYVVKQLLLLLHSAVV
ncbi:hypothetical protein PR202_gb17033 [Eleusine coracana subsp. coracana]|uniref:Uncharacterized protein n=1 Tax=Eleusine coracana subsp. coracana TaxID=191504 RepID=A0AAV5F3L3_ELECO|nr:hypothetical protein PR202_gb17033 [Eleusine coracana subsp. coracana]